MLTAIVLNIGSSSYAILEIILILCELFNFWGQSHETGFLLYHKSDYNYILSSGHFHQSLSLVNGFRGRWDFQFRPSYDSKKQLKPSRRLRRSKQPGLFEFIYLQLIVWLEMPLLQVVAFQAAMSIMAEQFPGAFAGYKLQVPMLHYFQLNLHTLSYCWPILKLVV